MEMIQCDRMRARITQARCDSYRTGNTKWAEKGVFGVDCTGCPGPVSLGPVSLGRVPTVTLPKEREPMSENITSTRICGLCRVKPVWKNSPTRKFKILIAGQELEGIGICSACYTPLRIFENGTEPDKLMNRLRRMGILPPPDERGPEEKEPAQDGEGKPAEEPAGVKPPLTPSQAKRAAESREPDPKSIPPDWFVEVMTESYAKERAVDGGDLLKDAIARPMKDLDEILKVIFPGAKIEIEINIKNSLEGERPTELTATGGLVI